ncbi:alpha/beta fold hydrolase [Pseudomonas borbori]|uniref:Pimeloyl-ACP methyl ester carboxylesterase n=1 Tax=Pseudomonas borbori TaxID=289003 RepID=A0A1I5KXX6_9PSED|nr:alpha/beta hydrolase [Pseudomonas borbori]SFO89895.1 Pimeloyl-ACP methyl ester carboxylesterase [Pseudomonas borbori]
MKKLLLGLILLLGGSAVTLYLCPAALLATVQLVALQQAELGTERSTVGDLSIHYYQGGPRDGETILMVHGFGASKDNWLRLARHFTQDYQVIALDLPGFGDSSKPYASYDVGTQVERLAAFTQALQIKKLHLIGSSMGGHISALYAARYPEQILSLALLANAGIDSPQKSELIERLERGEANPLIVKTAQQFEQLLALIFVEVPSMPERLQQALAQRSIANSAHNERVFAQLVSRYIPLEPVLPKIQAPTLLLWGAQDRVLHVSSIEVMQPLLQRPSVVIMQDCGHAPMLERPEETAEHYQAFLDSVAAEAE